MVNLKEVLNISCAKALADSIPGAAQMRVKVGYVTEMRTDRPATETMGKQPVTKPLQKLP
jgi:hypothetical protein